MITIIGLGPGSIKHLTLAAWETLRQSDTVFLRTARHACIADLPSTVRCHSFDEIYETHDQFDDVYDEIAERVLAAAQHDGEVVYAVPGDPLVGEASVVKIIKGARAASVEVDIIPGVSFVEPCLRCWESTPWMVCRFWMR